MATITLLSDFDIEDLWSADASGALLSSATTYRYQNAAGFYVELTGTFSPGTGVPDSGTVTQIRIYADAGFATLVATVASLSYVFSGGAYIGSSAAYFSGSDTLYANSAMTVALPADGAIAMLRTVGSASTMAVVHR